MQVGRSIVAAGFVLLWASASGARAQSQLAAPDYAKMAEWYVQAHAISDLPKDPGAVDPLLTRAFVALDVGVFDVRFPVRFLDDAAHVEEMEQALTALLDVQSHFAGWVGEAGADGKPAKPAEPPCFGVFRKFVKGLKPGTLAKGQKTANGSLLKAAGADEGTTKAVNDCAQWVRSRHFLGEGLAAAPAVRVVFAPTREEFVGFVSWLGSLSEANRKVWQPSLGIRTEQPIGDLFVLSLEYASPHRTEKEPWLGIPMNARERTGLSEMVTEYGAEYLVHALYGRPLAKWFEDGLCVESVVELVGEDNTRVRGSGEGSSTPAQSKFVRGGRSSGGKLAQISADSGWRTDKGKDHFVGALRTAQKEAIKEAEKQKVKLAGTIAHFLLNAEIAPDKKCIVSAPFVGALAESKEIPEPAHGEYAEFQRAYRCAFVFWLATEIKPKSDTAAIGFARLLRSCTAPPDGNAFEKDVENCFGAPLTSAEAGPDTLEGRFLLWIAQR